MAAGYADRFGEIAISWTFRRLLRHPQPVVHFLADLIFGIAVAILDLAFQLIATPIHDRQVVVREFSPFLLDLALELFPVTFDAIPIHHSTSGFFAIERVTPTRQAGSGALAIRLGCCATLANPAFQARIGISRLTRGDGEGNYRRQ